MSTEETLTAKNLTPMMMQFNEVKERFPDCILFFRMGDFFEMFGDDAVVASKVLGIALTSRNKNSENSVPMCGVPHHSYQQYMLKLIRKGYNVAICEQLEDPAQAKGIVRRGVTRVVTPGTIMDEGELPDASNNFLVAVHIDENSFYIAATDVSTGEVHLTKSNEQTAEDIVELFQPKEIIYSSPVRFTLNVPQSAYKALNPVKAAKEIASLYNVTSETVIGIDDPVMAVPFQMIKSYVQDSMLDVNYARPRILNNSKHLMLDKIASRTLELTESQAEGTTLFSVLNYTGTPMGQRMLRRLILNPWRDPKLINKRLDIVAYFVKNWQFTIEMEKLLTELYDIERIVNRVASRRATARELVWLRDSLRVLPYISDMLESTGVADIEALGDTMNDCGKIADLISHSIVDEPPVNLKEGGIIRQGYNTTVDELTHIKNNGRSMLAGMEADLKRQTGINQLKISYNKVFGYFIEVSKANAAKVPASFERRQTLVNAERYVTPELKELENSISGAEERLAGLEYDLFCSIRDIIAESTDMLRIAAINTAELDTFLSLAHAAVTMGYVRPEVDNSGLIEITDGRHPVVETNDKSPYVSNDVNLDKNGKRLTLLTGPNMAGKSTYMRSVALIAIMAHMGSFVPAKAARIGVLDRIFTRVGASDNISRGQSTFMVEMVETANILSHASADSLIILDEIGRGTSTFDGISIAWAVTEYILGQIRAKTLFATHYHELTELASSYDGVSNYTMAVKEMDGEIIFLRKVIPGAADRSYGIYVAELAGLPDKVTKRAAEVLADLEADNSNRTHIKPKEVVVRPMLIFDNEHPAIERLKALDIDSMTPVQALNLVAELKKTVDDV